MVEIKNGKVVFKQKSTSFDKLSETLQDIVKFRDMIEQRVAGQDTPLTVIPDEHRSVIAKLAHESDKTLPALTKHVRHQLLPAQDEDDDSSPTATALPPDIIESAIKSVAIRTNYGIDNTGKVPASLCVWRWEVKEEYRDWLPKAVKDKAEARLAERVQAKQDLATLFASLPQDERDALLGPKGNNHHKMLPPIGTNTTPPDATIDLTGDTKMEQPSKKQGKKKSDESENDAISESTLNAKPGPSRMKSSDPEKAAKEKEKLEKKAVKADKEKRAQEAQKKSRSIMANFFRKDSSNGLKTSRSSSSPSAPNKDTTVAGPSQNEFAKTFKPFVLKKDAELAPTNWFLDAKKRGRDNVIVIDDDVGIKEEPTDVNMEVVQEVDVSQMNERERLHSLLSSLPRSLHTPRLTSSTTRTLLSQLTEAEIVGSTTLVRSLLSTLRNRSFLPAKVFIFSEDARPGYFGTWTRRSNVIRARAPFAKDIVEREYGYDSGEEWEEDPADGGGDDVVEGDEGEEEGGTDDADSDLDSWLVDDDEILEEGDVVPVSPSIDMPPPPVPAKRKAEPVEDGGEKKIGKKRKVVVPLVPFAKGPCWERQIGRCEAEAFRPYRIQLFNDTPYPIDPFTFVSRSVLDKKLSTSDTFVPLPSLPPSDIPASAPSAPKVAPKTTFPAAHLTLLLDKITSLSTGNITFIVESIHQELRSGEGKSGKVKKNAIEAKVREVGEKCKEKKVWIVKEDYKVLIGQS